MAPAPSVAAHPHAANPGGHVYNVPRAPEVYTLSDPVDQAIPDEVREQFQRDESGRVLFFTAPPLHRRANHGVAEQYAGLGHSVRHLASIRQLREERARKRKERDEALAREQEASKKRAAAAAAAEEKEEEGASVRRDAEAEARGRYEMLEKVMLAWAAEIERGTKVLDEAIGGIENWKEMKRREREAVEGLTDEEMRVRNLRWYIDWAVEKGSIKEEERTAWEETLRCGKVE
jgi:chromatin structure-remodeling complex subunit RSC1/2